MKGDFKKILHKTKPLFLPCKENQFRAKLLGSDFLFCLMLILFTLRIIFLPFYLYFPQSIFFAKIISSEITNLLNQGRSDLGLNELAWNAKLAYAAELKAQDMLEGDYFAHTSPSGEKGWNFVEKAGYNYETAGENLAIGFLDSSEVHQAWNESPSHKENLLNPIFREVGIAVLTGNFEERETTVVVQFFGKPAVSASIPMPAPLPISTPNVISPPSISEPEPILPAPLLETPQIVPETAGAMNQGKDGQKIMPETMPLPANLELNFWNFFSNQYSELAEKAILMTAITLAFVLCLNILALILQPIENRLKWTMVRNIIPISAFSIFALIFLTSIEKSALIQMIPHNIKIQ